MTEESPVNQATTTLVPVTDKNGMTIGWKEKLVTRESVQQVAQPGGLAQNFQPQELT